MCAVGLRRDLRRVSGAIRQHNARECTRQANRLSNERSFRCRGAAQRYGRTVSDVRGRAPSFLFRKRIQAEQAPGMAIAQPTCLHVCQPYETVALFSASGIARFRDTAVAKARFDKYRSLIGADKVGTACALGARTRTRR